MSGLTIGAIRQALADQLRANIDNEINVSVRGESRPPPCITIDKYPRISYDQSLGNAVQDIEWVLHVDPGGDDESSVMRLDDFQSAGLGNNSSIVDAVNADPTLAGAVDDCKVIGAAPGDPGMIDVTLMILARREF